MSRLHYNKKYEQGNYPYNPDEFINYSSERSFSGCLIVPTSKLIRKLEFKYFESSDKPLPSINIFNIEKFAKNMFIEFFDKKKFVFISDSYKRALFEEAAGLTEFKLYARDDKDISSSILEKLETIIIGLKEKGITPENMSEQKADFFDNDRFSDVNELYGNYQQLLGEQYLDYPEIINRLVEFVNDNDNFQIVNDYLSKYEFILLSGFSQFTVPEAGLFGSLAKYDVPFALNIDIDSKNTPVFGNLKETVQLILEHSGNELIFKQLYDDKVIENKNPANYNDSPASVTLRKWLFNTEVNINNSNINESIKIFQAGDVSEEVDMITKLVKYQILHNGIKPYEICITSRQPEKYSNMFRMSFASNDIPANISDRFSLDSSIVVTAIIDALLIIKDGFKTSDVYKFLQNPLIGLSDDENYSEKVNKLMSVSNELRIFGGKFKGGINGWMKRVKSTLDFLEDKIRKGDFEDEKYQIENKIENIKIAFELLEIIKEKFNFINYDSELSIDAFDELIQKHIIKNFRIEENILSLLEELELNNDDNKNLIYRKSEELEKNSRALSEFQKVLNEFVRISLARKPDTLYTIDELSDKLITAVQAAKYNIKEKQNYGVEITSIEQSRGIPYKVMILCGTNDGSFPMAYQTDTFLGMELHDAEDKHMREEQIQFYQFLTNNIELLDRGEQDVYLFYPGFDNEKELIRSHFIDSLLRLAASNSNMNELVFKIDEMNESDIEKFPWVNSISSKNELFQFNNDAYKGVYKNTIDEIVRIKSIQTENEKVITDDLDDSLKDYLKNQKNKIYSVSSIDTYAACPYKYFAQRVLKLNEKEDFEKGLSFMESGSVLHEILYKFFMHIKTDSSLYQPQIINSIIGTRLLPELIDEYKIIIKNIANEVYNEQNIDTSYFYADKYNIIKDGGVLDKWIENEINKFESKNGEYFPTLFEQIFPDEDIDFELSNGIKFRGKIDRIDIKIDENGLHFIVIDYKRTESSIKNDNQIKTGKSYQMPVYIEAGKEVLSKYSNYVDYHAGAYFPIYAKNDYNFKNVLEKNGKINSEEVIASSVNNIGSMVDDISTGIYPVKPDSENVCKYCGFISVCKLKEKDII